MLTIMRKLFVSLLILFLAFPVLALAQEATGDAQGWLVEILSKFISQHWIQIIAEVVFFASISAAALPARWKIDKGTGEQRTWYKYFYAVVEFLAYNFGNAKSKDVGDSGVKR